jgi:hypothetical protein
MRKKLQKLIEESKEIRERNAHCENITYLNDYFEELSKFLFKKLRNPFFKNKNAKIIAEHFDEILPFIARPNIDILLLYSELLIDQPNFKEKFILGLKKYPYKDSIEEILYNMWCRLNANNKIDKYNEFLDDEVLKTLAGLSLDGTCYESILNRINEERQKSFLEILVEYKANISYLGVQYKGNNKKIIFDNLPLFMQNSQNLYNLMDFVKEDPTALEKIKEYIDNNEEQTIDSIFCETEKLEKITDQTIKDVLKLLIIEIIKNENAKYSDIEYNGGGFSRILLIGDKVIKIGNRKTKSFPNNPYIVAPLLRKEIGTNNKTCFVEVTERVETNIDISNEDLYQLYKKLRDLGLIWTDIKAQNVGRLKKENIIHWNKELKPSEKVLGLTEKRGDIILKEGELVVLDADFIYDENDSNINYVNNRELTEEFEKKYQNEKTNSIKKEGAFEKESTPEYEENFKRTR